MQQLLITVSQPMRLRIDAVVFFWADLFAVKVLDE